jgi:hypothetical protein
MYRCKSSIASAAGKDMRIGAMGQLFEAAENVVADASATSLAYQQCQYGG